MTRIDRIKLKNLLSKDSSLLNNKTSMDLLHSEKNSLGKCIQLGNEIKNVSDIIEENLEEQDKILSRNDDKIISIISIF